MILKFWDSFYFLLQMGATLVIALLICAAVQKEMDNERWKR